MCVDVVRNVCVCSGEICIITEQEGLCVEVVRNV